MLGFFAGLVLGAVFSVLGAGGGILAVPLVMFVFSMPASTATGAGLAVVWAAAMAGTVAHGRAGRVDAPTVGWFGLPSVGAAVLGARLHALVPEPVTLLSFSAVLLVSVTLLFVRPGAPRPPARWAVVLAGLGTGVLTGFLGVGGGFLIVPALVLLAGLPLPRAVGTSMAVIALSSFSGALAHLSVGHVPVELVLPMGGGAIVGALLGAPLSGRLPETPVRVGFAVLSVAVAISLAVKAVGRLAG